MPKKKKDPNCQRVMRYREESSLSNDRDGPPGDNWEKRKKRREKKKSCIEEEKEKGRTAEQSQKTVYELKTRGR